MRRVTVLNSVSGVLQIIVNIGILMLTVPVFIDALGFEAYGLFALITALGGLGIFTGFGFNASLIKHLSEQTDREESNYDIVTTLIILGGSSVIVAALLLIWSDEILLHVLNIAPETITPAVRSLYTACVVANVFQMAGQVPTAVLDAAQRTYLSNAIQLGVGLTMRGLMLLSLLMAPDLATLGWILLGCSAAGTMVLGRFAITVWGPVSFPDLRHRFRGVARKHFHYGRNVYATAIMGYLYEPMTKILIGHQLGLREVGMFDIAFRIKGVIWMVVEKMLYPILPIIAAHRDRRESRGLIEEVQRTLLVMLTPVFVAMPFVSSPAIRVWLGSSEVSVVVSVVVIVNCYLLALPFIPLYHFLTVKGFPHKTLVVQTTNAVVNAVVFFLLVPSVGYYGAVASYCAAILTSTCVLIHYQRTILDGSIFLPTTQAVPLARLGMGLAVVDGILIWAIPGNWTLLVSLFVAHAAATLVLYRSLHLFSVADVERYFGRGNRIGMALERLLIRNA
jgi:O-antigen/teichoic acid export membrane protein